jgi:hypothetical protein
MPIVFLSGGEWGFPRELSHLEIERQNNFLYKNENKLP